MVMAMIQTIPVLLLLHQQIHWQRTLQPTHPTDTTIITTHTQVNDGDDIETHKEFLIQLINSLICCVQNDDTKIDNKTSNSSW